MKYTLGTLAILIPAAILFSIAVFIQHSTQIKPENPNVKDQTENGNHYVFNLNSKQRENGYLVNVYLCETELRQAWNNLSAFPFDSLDKKSQQLSQTLIRYLTSLGLRKDSAGVSKLTNSDIEAIENGIANVHSKNISSFKSRLLELNWELEQLLNNQNPSGHSLTMRFEFWKAGWAIWMDNFWTGVGTGDLQDAFNNKYNEMNSSLDISYRYRAHNQFLSTAIAFGIFGLLYFLITLVYPLLLEKKNSIFFYINFLIILMLSMLTEDTLETQAGATFFGFFNSLFIFRNTEAQ
jgi:hypothetical protein